MYNMEKINRIAGMFCKRTGMHGYFDDLVQEGHLAALKAMLRYRPQCGATINSFCGNAARFAMIDYLRKNGPAPVIRQSAMSPVTSKHVSSYTPLVQVPITFSSDDTHGFPAHLLRSPHKDPEQIMIEAEETYYGVV